jgi:hypothetical protein
MYANQASSDRINPCNFFMVSDRDRRPGKGERFLPGPFAARPGEAGIRGGSEADRGGPEPRQGERFLFEAVQGKVRRSQCQRRGRDGAAPPVWGEFPPRRRSGRGPGMPRPDTGSFLGSGNVSSSGSVQAGGRGSLRMRGSAAAAPEGARFPGAGGRQPRAGLTEGAGQAPPALPCREESALFGGS